MTRVLLVGQPHWAQHLARLLNEWPGDLHAEALDGSRLASPAGCLGLIRTEAVLRVGFRPAATTLRGLAFDTQWDLFRAMLNPWVRTAYYWIGSDVLFARQDAESGRLHAARWARAREDVHLVGAPWFVDELRPLGIESTCILFPAPLPDFPDVPPLPRTFSVLTYIPDARHTFYGSEAIYRCAQALPEVPFRVLGGKGTWVEHPLPNLHFLGWQPDIRPFLADATVLVRLVPHDALGGTVREALAAGRQVVYTFPIPHVHRVDFGDWASLLFELQEFRKLSMLGDLRLNHEGRTYALKKFNPDESICRIVEFIHGLASAPSQL